MAVWSLVLALLHTIQLGSTLQSKDALVKTHHDCLELQAKLSKRYMSYARTQKRARP